MAKRNRLTNNSDETEIASLLSTPGIFLIPYFQRAYKWKIDRIKQLQKDILSLVDEEIDHHFLGAVIVHGRRNNPSEPKVFEVIDGQQRITTLYVLICAIVKILCEKGQPETAYGLFEQYLFLFRETKSLLSNYKLHPCKEDRTQLNIIMAEIINNKYIKEKIKAIKYKPLPEGGASKGCMINNYRAFLRFLKEQYEKEDLPRIEAIYNSTLEAISVVQIDVNDPTNGPKIFDSLNSRQEPMTIGDLVRNGIFSKIAGDSYQVEHVETTFWQPFYQKFKQNEKNLFDDYFFPYGLIQHPNLAKSQVYTQLREDWNTQDPENIIESLSKYQNPFLELCTGKDYLNLPKSTRLLFKNLHDLGMPGSTLPFLMQLANALKVGSVLQEDGNQILEIIESFLVRRAVCGHEPTGLHAVFKRLWVDCGNNPTATKVIEKIKEHKTVVWPDDFEFTGGIRERNLGSVGITPYVLASYDKSMNGDNLSYEGAWVEHILPVKMSPSWYEYFTKDMHEELNDTIGNLLILSANMNREISNRSYEEKKKAYELNSKYKSARELAKTNDIWTPDNITKRSKEFADWAVNRWKF